MEVSSDSRRMLSHTGTLPNGGMDVSFTPAESREQAHQLEEGLGFLHTHLVSTCVQELQTTEYSFHIDIFGIFFLWKYTS